MIFTSIMLVAIFYLNYYILIPKLLSKRKFKEFAGAIIMLLAVVYVLSYFNRPDIPDFAKMDKFAKFQERTEAPQMGEDMRELNHPMPPSFNETDEVPKFEERRDDTREFDRRGPGRRPVFFNFGILILSTISLAVSTSIRGTKEWFINEKQLKEIENQKLTAELSYLKAQINPHFFFNTLNGIYALARQKSDQTPDVILKLSDLMRYIIYEANTSKVLLSREINHLENYIDLQKIRLSEIVQVSFRVIGTAGILQIEPLLFSGFLENAFKHGIDYSRPGKIDILLEIKEDGLIFVVKNPIPKLTKETNAQNSGVGLKNIKQRLQLVFPNRHKLNIYQKEGQHIVELYLKLNTDEVYNN